MNILYNGEMDPRQCKVALPAAIQKLADEDSRVVYLDADLSNCIGMTKWLMSNPDRAFDCGIAEANMIGVACGLAATGLKPIVHSFGCFSSRRVFDQVFLSAGYARNDIIIIGTDAGVTAALNGGTHMPFEDIAIYRTIPTATVIDITDPNMIEGVLRQCIDLPGVKYIRLSRKNYARVYEEGASPEIGKATVLRDGTDISIFASGIMVHEAMQAAKRLEEEGISAAVLDMFSIKPLDKEAVKEFAAKTGAVLTAENASRNGGLYDAVLQVVAENCPCPAGCVAVNEEYGEVGPQNYLQERFGLTADNIYNKAKEIIARKK